MYAVVTADFLDPESAQFKGLTRSSPGYRPERTICGFVNAKNSFGGYVGFRPFSYPCGTEHQTVVAAYPAPPEAVRERPKIRAMSWGLALSVAAAAVSNSAKPGQGRALGVEPACKSRRLEKQPSASRLTTATVEARLDVVHAKPDVQRRISIDAKKYAKLKTAAHDSDGVVWNPAHAAS